MKNIEEIKRQLSSLKETIHIDYGVSRIGVFGSYVRDEQREDSDLDVVELEQFLSNSLGIKTDVVLRRSVHRELKDISFGEAVPG